MRKVYQFSTDNDYVSWFKDIKRKVNSLQIKAALAVNVELLSFYWDLGREITEKQATKNWGEAIVEQLSKDLLNAFPDMKGFSRSNLFYMKKWYLFYNQYFWGDNQLSLLANINHHEKIQQLVGQIPWGHNILIITKVKNIDEAVFYTKETLTNGWSRAVLSRQIESDLYSRQGKAITNFIATLPKPHSDLAHQTLKDPYVFDIMTISKKADEKVLKIN